jgi:flagellar biogenesis protein FliO
MMRPALSGGTWRSLRTPVRVGTVAALVCLYSAPALAQTLGQPADDEISLWRVASALLLCILLAVLAAFVLKMRTGHTRLFSYLTPKSRRLEVIEAVRLGPQVELCIVACDGRELLIAASPQNIHVLEHLGPVKKQDIPDSNNP